DPPAHGVVPAGEVPGVVRVQALHAPPGTPDATGRAGAVVAGGDRRVALARVPLVRAGQLARIHRGGGRLHPAGRLERRHLPALTLAYQPVAGRHRCAVDDRRVADDHGFAVSVAHHDFDLAPWPPAEQRGDPFHVAGQRPDAMSSMRLPAGSRVNPRPPVPNTSSAIWKSAPASASRIRNDGRSSTTSAKCGCAGTGSSRSDRCSWWPSPMSSHTPSRPLSGRSIIVKPNTSR